MSPLPSWLFPLALAFAAAAQAEGAGEAEKPAPPFPEAWDPYPLRYPYAADPSVFLKAPPAAPSVRPQPHALPAARRPVRVLLSRGRGLEVAAAAGARLQLRHAGGGVSEGPRLQGNLRVERVGGEFRVSSGGSKPFSAGPVQAMRLVPEPPGWLQIGGKPYRGNLEFHAEGEDMLCANSLPMRDYLRGVLPVEMGRREAAGLEALKAQAVVARTYALKRMQGRQGAPFDLHATVQDQVYGGAGVEYPLADRAVSETDGIILLHADTLALGFYHSTCGGMTASRHEVWAGPNTPYLLSRPDRDAEGQAYCRASSFMQWAQDWEAGALAAIIRTHAGAAGVSALPSFRALTGFRVRERFADGRVRVLEVDTDGGSFELRGDKARFALKPGKGTGRILESARFDIALEGTRVTARGGGFGHGVGLCQMGALGRSQAGQGFAEILQAYYPGTELAKAQ